MFLVSLYIILILTTMSDEHDAFLFDEEEDDAFAYEEEEDTGKKSATQNDKSSKAKRTSSVESRGKHEKKRFETPPRAYGQSKQDL